MQRLTASLISGKKVLLRYDIDVPVENGRVFEDFRLNAGLETLDFCLDHAQSVVLMGHLGRPNGKEDPRFSVKPVVEWFEEKFGHVELPKGKFHVLENLRFDPKEEEASLEFAKELSKLGSVFVNESFAAYRPAASTTVLPKLLPHGAGFRFESEVKTLMAVRDNPVKPLVVIMGGAKIEDKLPVISEMAKIADAVLVGGKLPLEIKQQDINVAKNVLVAKLNESGTDIADEVVWSWNKVIGHAKQILWNGPLGKFEEVGNNQTKKIAEMVIASGAQTIVGGGDTVAALGKYDLLDKISFVSTGGGAMLKLLSDGTLPTIKALE
ncbi:phosphoglycerate kinase [Candidatus Daviesbacteria bacterium]|nr:phosphoglycerate kinase [Candidatus Daviesbacteria bacterium]